MKPSLLLKPKLSTGFSTPGQLPRSSAASTTALRTPQDSVRLTTLPTAQQIKEGSRKSKPLVKATKLDFAPAQP
jgi:hypothetical protein